VYSLDVLNVEARQTDSCCYENILSGEIWEQEVSCVGIRGFGGQVYFGVGYQVSA
jgi:hypothetical protein